MLYRYTQHAPSTRAFRLPTRTSPHHEQNWSAVPTFFIQLITQQLANHGEHTSHPSLRISQDVAYYRPLSTHTRRKTIMAPRRWSKRLYRYWKPGRPSPASPVPPPTATLPTVLPSTSPASTAPPSYITVLQPQATPHPLPIYAEFMSPPYTPASTITDTIAPSLRPPSLASSASVYPVPEYSTRRSQSSTSQASEHACSQSQVSSAQPPRSPTSRSPAAQSLGRSSLTVQVSTSESSTSLSPTSQSPRSQGSTSRTTPSQIPTSPNTPSASNVEPPPKQEESGVSEQQISSSADSEGEVVCYIRGNIRRWTCDS